MPTPYQEDGMANRYPKKITLKSGEVVELRPLAASDEAALVAFFAALPPESTEFLKDDVRDPEVVKRFIRKADPDTIWAMLAVAGDKIVGDATLHVSQIGWRRHVGEVRVVVAPDYHKQRLATALIHELVNQASHKELQKLEAQILDSQVGARKAFEKLGFSEEARLKEHAIDLQGRLHDLVILTNTVDDLWSKMEDMISDMEHARDGY
jgi:RimJ/RimL family protein N-acetyltransferase